jgi:hypothetical protein
MAQVAAGNYERTDFSARGVLIFAAGLIVMTGLSALLVAVFMHYWTVLYPLRLTRPLWQDPRRAPAPRLQTSPSIDLETLRKQDEGMLHQYGWIDREAGVVRIPIERAMELVVQRGLPVRTKPNPRGVQPTGKTSEQLPPPVRRMGSIGNP